MTENKVANPSPLGLLGFGMTTILLNLHNAGITQMSSVLIAMGLAMGGLAQIIAGIMEFKNNNLFGATAFSAYGLFWWSLVVIWLSGGADALSMGFYLLLWGIFTLFMAIGTLKHNKISRVVFFSLAVLFFCLSLGDFTHNAIVTTVAGYIGIFCGCSALYSAVGQILNHEFKKEVLPLG